MQDQVVVITGASSGIGRETALAFAERGACVVVAARGNEALEALAGQIAGMGGTVEVVVTDVADPAAVQRLADRALERFGRIDTWVNNAAVSIYSSVADLTPEEMEQVVRVNLLGQMFGSRAALLAMRPQGRGVIVNVGSALSERGVPLQSAYVATKHAIRGFTEALRLELDRDSPGIHVTLIEPGSMNTPLFDHARVRVSRQPMPIPPIYEPRAVADAIVETSERPHRDIVVGGAAKMLTVGQRINPAIVDAYMLQGDRMWTSQLSDDPPFGQDNLFAPLPGPGSTTGRFGEQAKPISAYTRLFEYRPTAARVAAAGALAAALMILRAVRR